MIFNLKPLIGFLFTIFYMNLPAQTIIPTGSVSGTWQKSGSPYKVSGNVYVPVGQKLTITEGVTVEFQDTWKMDVYGKIVILGKPNDTVVFTAKNKTNGWKGIKVYGQNATDTLKVWYGKFEYFKTQEQYYNKSRAVLKIDSIKGLVQILGSRFNNNHGISNSGLNVNTSNLWIKNCQFDHNLASDLRTVNTGAGYGSAAILRNCSITVDSISSHHNRNASPNLIKDSTSDAGSKGCFILWDCKGDIKNSVFNYNYSTSRGAGIYFTSTGLQKYTVNVSKCVLKGNVSRGSGAIAFDIVGSSTTDKIILEHCLFSQNKSEFWRSKNYITYESADILAFDANGLIYINNCEFISADAGNCITIGSSIVYVSNSVFTQNPGVAINCEQGGYIELKNSIIGNNGWGIMCSYSSPVIVNSIIANNYPEPSLLDRYLGAGYGLFVDFSGGAEVTNSIISGHRDSNGRFTNVYLFGTALKCKNSIIEGSYDSFKYDYRVTPSKPTVWDNMFNVNPEWVNPTAGAGIGYDAYVADWHLKNTCGLISPGFDAGSKVTVNLDKIPTDDMEGNPRTVGDAPDIGPYEIQNPNKYTRIIAEPRDTSFCAGTGNVILFNNNSIGNNLSYQWQKSSAQNGTFSNINGANSQTLTTSVTKGSVTEWYRVIVKNSLCNNSDTSRVVKLNVNPLPSPKLGSDTTIVNSGNILLNPGSFNNYQWFTGATSTTLTVNKTNLDTGKNIVWVEVTDSKGCKDRDTAIITLEPVNGLQNPFLSGIRIYPIPSEQFLNIEFPEMNSVGKSYINSYQISNLEGRSVQEGVLDKNSNSIDIAKIPSGTYILDIQYQGKRYGLKISK
ncbi:MAG: T9SS type A sorting domain-containing protein [Bacteroidetes bacterium]|nr:T9SS type A sorting domain-containing protein [Bacteroidota bacterium]